jgi:recombination protein RecA
MTKHDNSDVVLKRKMLEITFAQIDKQYGSGAVMLLGASPIKNIDVVSSGSLLIDNAIGVGGFPRGRIIEIFGPEASGKTTLALHVVAQSQASGGICAFIDAEHALDQQHAKNIGVAVEDLIISQPDYGEQALDIAEMLIRSSAIDIIVIDSVAALVPKAELEGDMGDVHMGLQARLMSQALRKLTPVVHKSKTVLIFINQIRQTLSTMPYGPKETTTGGNALKFYASVRCEVRKIASLKKKDEHVGNRIAVKMVKNKVAPPFKKIEVDLLFNEGISKHLDLLDAALQMGIITQAGSWFAYEGEKIAQGREQVLAELKSNVTTAQAITKKVKEAFALQKNSNIVDQAEMSDNDELERT